jgi:primosomal protein N' (replication factor Y)
MAESLLFPEVHVQPAQPEVTRYAQVVFNRPLSNVFTYGLNRELQHRVAPGQRLIVPFGRGNAQAIGYCVGLTEEKPDRRVKLVTKTLDIDPLFTPALLELTRWLAGYYVCGWGQALDAVIPAAAKTQAGSRDRDFITALPEPLLPAILPRLTRKQHQAMEYLRAHTGPQDARFVADQIGCGLSVLWALVKRGYATREKRRVESHLLARPAKAPTETSLALNARQQEAFVAILSKLQINAFHTFLLHGVTGSGKTEVYLQAIHHVVKQGKQALVLVPEISLTPQAVQRFEARFGSVAVLHSHLTDADRGGQWRRIAAGQVPVVVGARSAIFAPTPNLGLIVVDEEHETSFKQETTPRYHARDLAIKRAQLEGVPIVLGSATPSLESWNNARKGLYTLLELPERVGDKPMPPVGLIDMRHEPMTASPYKAISPSLESAMKQALAGNGQVILLLNRRGFDTALFCPSCGQVVKCKFCDVAMTYHRNGRARGFDFGAFRSATLQPTTPGSQGEQRDLTGKAICHYCGYEVPPPRRCTSCGVGSLRYLGLGTEKLEEELGLKFPGVPAARMDADAMRRTGSHAKVFEAFQRGEVRILFGTQMIAKGLDIPTVTLVGVINADLALHLPDFRSSERTFQLLAQVAGRAGRGDHGGKVLVQTYHPDHPSIRFAIKHDYHAFAAAELAARTAHAFPPTGRLIRIIVRSKTEKKARAVADTWDKLLKPHLKTGIKILGPAPAPLKKLEGWYRHHLLVVSSAVKPLHTAVKTVRDNFKTVEGVEVSVDVDPMSML